MSKYILFVFLTYFYFYILLTEFYISIYFLNNKFNKSLFYKKNTPRIHLRVPSDWNLQAWIISSKDGLYLLAKA